MTSPLRQAPGALYVALVASLYRTLAPIAIMSVAYVTSVAVMAFETEAPVLKALIVVGGVSSALRLAVVAKGAAEARDPGLGVNRARALERIFAIAYFQFAIVLGLTGAYVFSFDQPRYHMLMMCLLVGYGAGAAVGVGLRPLIAIPSMCIAIVPAIIAMSLHRDPIYWTAAAMTAALLVGGSFSLFQRFQFTSSGIGDRLFFQSLARQDALTTLPNRLALREWFEENSAIGEPHEFIAVHCLDLNHFKPVNDTYGHAAGDELLRTLSLRLKHSVRAGDIVARLGGDEFAVIQRGIRGINDGAALARNLRATIAEPFAVKGRVVQVTTCVGFVVCHWNSGDLEELLALADEVLYRAKKSGNGIEFVSPLKEIGDRVAEEGVAA
jgi:diguanylate cyclase (GGDEF)-like protein